MNNDNSVLKWVVIGLVSLSALSFLKKLFGQGAPGPDDVQASEFLDPVKTPEVWSANPVQDGLDAGTLFPYMIADTAKRAGTIGVACNAFYNSRGIVNDSEGKAVAAFSVPATYSDLCFFCYFFRTTYGTSVGAYASEFLGATELAALYRIVQNRRSK